MRAFHLCRPNYPTYDGEGARRAGGRWNSKGNAVVYMSENRSLALLEILVHLSIVIPNRHVLGAAEIPDDLSVEELGLERSAGQLGYLGPQRAGCHPKDRRYLDRGPAVRGGVGAVAADQVGRVLIFDFRYNRYRLIVTVEYPKRRLYIKALLTHKYDREEWKKWA